MINGQIQTAIRTLQAQGQSVRHIARLLKLSRNAVRRVLRGAAERSDVSAAAALEPNTRQALLECFERARGNAVRIRELLKEQGREISYSTLTRWVREQGLREPIKRAGEYTFTPGEESQHDTSPHRVMINGKTLTAQCAGLVLAYSRRLFIYYYPRFTRFEAKHFLLEAARFMDGTCPRCVVDNTSVVVAAGTGNEALIAPEMAAFARALGFVFVAHRLNHPDRKGRIERPFAYVEGNFLPGRTFRDFDDLNHQARAWCIEIANARVKRVLGMSPEAAYVIEKPSLQPLPLVLAPVYEALERTVDLYGYVSLETNRYSVPERFVGQSVTVYKYPERVEIHHRGQVIATHARLREARDGRATDPQHHPLPVRVSGASRVEEQLLRRGDEVVARYCAALKQQAPGRGVRRLKRLLELERTYPPEAFLKALESALAFGLFDLARLEALVLKHVAGDFFALDLDGDSDA